MAEQMSKGPWRVEVRHTGSGPSFNIVTLTGLTVAICKAANGAKEANAHAIAEVPSMVALLRIFAKAHVLDPSEILEAEKEARALIARINGGES